MSKQPVSFRISSQAVKNLQIVCQKTGSNQTAAVENALAVYAAQLKGEVKMSDTMDHVLEYLGTSMIENDVQKEFGGKTNKEILEILDNWFPTESNKSLAGMISAVIE